EIGCFRINPYLTNMLQEYSISDLFPKLPKQTPYYVYSFRRIDMPHLVWPYKCDFYSIVWFTKGYGLKMIDFTKYAIFPNRIFLISPDQIHNKAFRSEGQGYVLMFNKVVAVQLGIDFTSPYADISTGYEPLLRLVVENMIHKGTDSNIETDLLYFYSLIVDQIDKDNFEPKGLSALFREFKKLILRNDLKNQSINQYADTLHISFASLNNICKNFAGSSAKQFLLNIKIVEAKRLLIYSWLNVSDIAYRLGFEDASYFSRIFKKKTSLSPSAFSEKYRK
ncbi:MAG: AraC family transcriptional regulator, partial [Massilibacteroides sp.]|nr:AraC family transcriptional regulator [Massilibacteroides sp.]